MGYCISVGVPDFRIKASNTQKALEAIQSLHGKETCPGRVRHFSWVHEDFYKIDNFVEILNEWRWRATENECGDITKLCFEGEKLGDDDLLFKAIGPFVEAGSQINFRGEDGYHWQYRFDGKTMKKYEGKVVFEESEES